jgi:hypothetical protein
MLVATDMESIDLRIEPTPKMLHARPEACRRGAAKFVSPADHKEFPKIQRVVIKASRAFRPRVYTLPSFVKDEVA